MKAVVFHEHGSVEKLAIEHFPDPECGPDDVVLKVEATSLNGFDPMILGGSTGLKTPLPMIPCGDIAGSIAELGSNLDGSRWQLGDRVCPHPFVFGEGMTGETRLGAACEFVRIPAANLLAIPDGVSFAQAASLPIAYGTAYRMMRTRGEVRAGERVLILGATGGVGMAGIQLAKRAGATVLATASSDEKLERLEEFGLDHGINYRERDFVEVVRELTGGRGADVVVDSIGGHVLEQSPRMLLRLLERSQIAVEAGLHVRDQRPGQQRS